MVLALFKTGFHIPITSDNMSFTVDNVQLQFNYFFTDTLNNALDSPHSAML